MTTINEVMQRLDLNNSYKLNENTSQNQNANIFQTNNSNTDNVILQKSNFSVMDIINNPKASAEDNLDISFEDIDPDIAGKINLNSDIQNILNKSPNDLHSEDDAIIEVQNGNTEYKVNTSTDAKGNTVEEREYANGVKYKKTTTPSGTSETYIFNPATGNYIKEIQNKGNGTITRKVGNENTGDYELEKYDTSFWKIGPTEYKKGNSKTGDYEHSIKDEDGSYSVETGNEINGDYEYHYYGIDGAEQYKKQDNTTGDYEDYTIDSEGNEEHNKRNSITGIYETYYKFNNGSEEYKKRNANTGDYEFYTKDSAGNELIQNGNKNTGEYEYKQTTTDGIVAYKKGNEKTGEYEITITYPDGTVKTAHS